MFEHLSLLFPHISKGLLISILRYMKIFQNLFHLLNIMIMHMVEEMLEVGIPRPSQSSYSAPVVMVHKKEGSWHMCPDYREFNKITIKDLFPISVIDELLDELHEAVHFTKLDLHSGYHQIRMKEEDVPKTMFRTHESHYDFLVMHLAYQMHLPHFKVC